MEPNSRRYDLFISYSTDPDAALTRDVERFVESFHRLRTPQALTLRPLQVCRDGSDFSLARLQRGAGGEVDAVTTLIHDYLGQSERLLVVGSARARESRWVNLEVRWFLEHRGAGQLLLAVSEGADPAQMFPAAVLEAGLHHKPWYDFRGFKAAAARDWPKVKSFEDEKVRLAADLNGHSAGEVQPVWFREQERSRRRRWTLGSTVLAVLLVLGSLAYYQQTVARREEGLKRIALAYESMYREPSSALLQAQRAGELLPGEAAARAALKAAYKVAVLQQHNRRETAQMTGSGPAYLAGRWKQGDVYTTASLDGRYRLVVTERGDNGQAPPGDIYLVNNESLRTVKLESCAPRAGRVEDVAFDQSSQHIFVSRYFDVNVYDLAGRCQRVIEMSCCTKSPVHLVRGLLDDRYAIVAETKGGLWLVDITADKPSPIELQREFHGDAAVAAVLSTDRHRAALVFESGRVARVQARADGKPALQDVVKQGALLAAFDPAEPEQLFVTGNDGTLQHFDLGGVAPVERSRWKIAETAIDDLSFSDDRGRLLAAGENGTMYVVERPSGRVLASINEAEGIDWANARAVAGEPISTPPQGIDKLPTLPLDDAVFASARKFEAAGREWAVTQTPGASAGHVTYLIDRERGLASAVWAGDAQTVERVGELFWLKRVPFMSDPSDGPVFGIDGGAAVFYPAREVAITAAAQHDGTVYLGSRRGLYALRDTNLSRISRPTWEVRGLYPIGERLWVATRQGGYLIEHDRLYRITEPFARIRAVKAVAGTVWMLSDNPAGKLRQPDGPGPAYRVDGYLSRPLPHEKARVADVIEAAGRTWLAARPGLYVIDGELARPVAGIAEDVSKLEVADGRLEVHTEVRQWPYTSDGPTYEVDPQSLAVRRH